MSGVGRVNPAHTSWATQGRSDLSSGDHNGGVSSEGTGEIVEEYGPKWEPGPFEAGTDGPRVILAGVDGSRTSLRAAAYAAGLARRQNALLVGLYVITPSAWAGMAPEASAAQAESHDEILDELRHIIRERADDIVTPITLMVRRGDAFTEIKRAAHDLRADMVVVGASEQTGHRLVGSIAVRLVRSGHWPVAVVP